MHRTKLCTYWLLLALTDTTFALWWASVVSKNGKFTVRVAEKRLRIFRVFYGTPSIITVTPTTLAAVGSKDRTEECLPQSEAVLQWSLLLLAARTERKNASPNLKQFYNDLCYCWQQWQKWMPSVVVFRQWAMVSSPSDDLKNCIPVPVCSRHMCSLTIPRLAKKSCVNSTDGLGSTSLSWLAFPSRIAYPSFHGGKKISFGDHKVFNITGMGIVQSENLWK